MSEADKRVLDLLDRWYGSLELHARYLKLSDPDYARVQAWPKHQRPNKWIIDLAKQRRKLAHDDRAGAERLGDETELGEFCQARREPGEACKARWRP